LSGFLLDTNVVSMLAPSKSEASADFLTWLDRKDADGRLFLSVVSIHEIEKGIALLDYKGATAKAASLKAWLSGLVSTYDDKIILLRLHRARPVLRSSSSEAGWRATPDSDDHYVFAVAL
jgi:predicted nucleic acid-binding protein